MERDANKLPETTALNVARNARLLAARRWSHGFGSQELCDVADEAIYRLAPAFSYSLELAGRFGELDAVDELWDREYAAELKRFKRLRRPDLALHALASEAI